MTESRPNNTQPISNEKGIVTRPWWRFFQTLWETVGETNGLVSVGAVATGGMVEFGGGSSLVPIGWLECDGTAISRDTYADLFNIIGVTYGDGDGSTTFNLPTGPGTFGLLIIKT